MPTKAKKDAGRNRSAEARAKGRVLRAFEISSESDQIIDYAADHLRSQVGSATRVQALEWLIRAGGKKIPKKTSTGLDTD